MSRARAPFYVVTAYFLLAVVWHYNKQTPKRSKREQGFLRPGDGDGVPVVDQNVNAFVCGYVRKG